MSESKALSLKENVVMRLIGLFIFLFPRRGSAFLVDVHLRTAEQIAAMKREARERSLAA